MVLHNAACFSAVVVAAVFIAIIVAITLVSVFVRAVVASNATEITSEQISPMAVYLHCLRSLGLQCRSLSGAPVRRDLLPPT